MATTLPKHCYRSDHNQGTKVTKTVFMLQLYKYKYFYLIFHHYRSRNNTKVFTSGVCPDTSTNFYFYSDIFQHNFWFFHLKRTTLITASRVWSCNSPIVRVFTRSAPSHLAVPGDVVFSPFFQGADDRLSRACKRNPVDISFNPGARVEPHYKVFPL